MIYFWMTGLWIFSSIFKYEISFCKELIWALLFSKIFICWIMEDDCKRERSFCCIDDKIWKKIDVS